MKNVLITGGAGFIGSKIALKLYEKNYNVRVLDNLSEQVHGENAECPKELKNRVEFMKGDVRNKKDLKKALDGQDGVIHLAAETGTGQSMYEIGRYTDINITGTSNLLDLLTNSNKTIEKVIIASSRAVYGEGKYICKNHNVVFPAGRLDKDMLVGDYECKCPICGSNLMLVGTDEDSKLHPTSIYGITKQMQEQMVMLACESIGIPAVAFRYQNVYGPGQSLLNPYTGILSIFSTRIKNNNDIIVFEDGEESRDFVYIDDVATATILGLEKNEGNNQIFNVGSGIKTSVNTVANTLKNAYNSNINIRISGNYRLGDIRHNFADITKINKKLGFSPKVLFSEGIRNFVKWAENQEINEDNYDKSIEEMKKRGLYK